jgi:hypothetical protein
MPSPHPFVHVASNTVLSVTWSDPPSGAMPVPFTVDVSVEVAVAPDTAKFPPVYVRVPIALYAHGCKLASSVAVEPDTEY